MKNKKDWTVLIYANGNNDLDKNIYKQFQLLKSASLPRNINVVVQIAGFHRRESVDENTISSEKELMVCRYRMTRSKARLIKKLEETSMATPAVFLDFLLWGIDEFPSKNLMLIVSGHGFGFIGLLGDRINNKIHFMSLQGFAKALSQFRQTAKKEIDILVFDVCYMNLVEILYEIALTPGQAVDCMILAQDNPSAEGLPWSAIINSLKTERPYAETMIRRVSKIVSSMNKTLAEQDAIFAVCLSPDHFVGLKGLTGQLSDTLSKASLQSGMGSIGSGFGQKDRITISLPNLLSQLRKKNNEISELETEIMEVLDQIVLCPKLSEIKSEQNLGLNIFLPENSEDYHQVKDYYDKLLFCQNNSWLNIAGRYQSRLISYPLFNA